MRNLFLCIAVLISFPIFSQTSTIVFNHFTGLTSANKAVVTKTYYAMNDDNNHFFQFIDTKERSTYQYQRLLKMAKERALILQQYFVTEQGLALENVVIQYGGEFPLLHIRKPKALYAISGEINLEEKYRQCYSYTANQPKTIYTDNGNTFSFPAGAFETLEGQQVKTGNVDICIWEFADKKSLIYANLTTHSSDKMLETGGSFYIEAKLDGEPLQLSNGTNYQVQLKTKQNFKDMFTYYGASRDGAVYWEVNKSEPVYLSETSPSSISERTVMSEDEFGDPTIATTVWDSPLEYEEDAAWYEDEGDETFYQLSAGKLGWINCDRFYDAKSTSALAVVVDTKEPVSVRVVFRDIESVMPAYASSNHKDQYKAMGIPTGEKVLILAYSLKDDNAIMGYKEVVVGENDTEKIVLEKYTKSRFESAVAEMLY